MFLSIFSASASSVVALSAVIDRKSGEILRKARPMVITAMRSSVLKDRPTMA